MAAVRELCRERSFAVLPLRCGWISMSGVRNELDDTRSYLQQLLLSVDGAEEEGIGISRSFLIPGQREGSF